MLCRHKAGITVTFFFSDSREEPQVNYFMLDRAVLGVVALSVYFNCLVFAGMVI